MLVPNGEMLVPNGEMLVPNVEMLVPNVEMLVPNVEMLVPNLEMLVPNREMLVPNVEMLVPNREILVPNREMLCANLEIPLPNREILRANWEILLPCWQMPESRRKSSFRTLNGACEFGEKTFAPGLGAQNTAEGRFLGHPLSLLGLGNRTPTEARLRCGPRAAAPEPGQKCNRQTVAKSRKCSVKKLSGPGHG